MSDPKRLFEELRDGELRDLLAAGKSETPDDHQMAALAAKIGLLGGLGGAGAAGAGGAGGGGAGAGAAGAGAKAGAAVGAAKGALAIKVVGAVAVAGAVSAGTVVATRHADAPRAAPIGIVASAPGPAATAGEPSVRLAPRIDPLASAAIEPSAKPVPARSAAPASPSDEVKLLERAQDALRTRPDEALALCNDHARTFPNGMLVQEREVIAIEALVKSGRTDEARARAARFKARWPGSSHARRIDTLVGP
jgi:hypothetical protein